MFRIPTEEEVRLTEIYLKCEDPEEIKRLEARLEEIEKEKEGSLYGRD